MGGREGRGREKQQIPSAVDFSQVPLVNNNYVVVEGFSEGIRVSQKNVCTIKPVAIVDIIIIMLIQ